MHWLRLLPAYFVFLLLVSFRQCSMLIFIYMLLLLEGQTGEVWKPAEENDVSESGRTGQQIAGAQCSKVLALLPPQNFELLPHLAKFRNVPIRHDSAAAVPQTCCMARNLTEYSSINADCLFQPPNIRGCTSIYTQKQTVTQTSAELLMQHARFCKSATRCRLQLIHSIPLCFESVRNIIKTVSLTQLCFIQQLHVAALIESHQSINAVIKRRVKMHL